MAKIDGQQVLHILTVMKLDLETLWEERGAWLENVQMFLEDDDYMSANFELSKLCALRSLEDQIGAIEHLFKKTKEEPQAPNNDYIGSPAIKVGNC